MKRNLRTGKQLNGGLSLNILTEDELNEIHLGTLELLETTGIYVEDEIALDHFESGGARVDRDSRIVRIPPYLVEEAIRSAPAKVVLAGQAGLDRKLSKRVMQQFAQRISLRRTTSPLGVECAIRGVCTAQFTC